MRTETLSHIDDGIALPEDPELADLLERHCRWDARPCLICGEPGGPECVRCLLDHDALMRRADDQ